MARRKKMNAEEMEKWLLSQGAKPVTKKMQKSPGMRRFQNCLHA